MQKLKTGFFFLIGLAFLVGCFYLFLQKPAPAKYQLALESSTLEIGGKVLTVEVAETDTEREQGLSDRVSLPTGHGMLFIFETVGNYGFWMKDMNFPIDIVWLNEAKQVVDIARNVTPDTFPHVFYPPAPVKYVLETNPREL